MSNFIFDVTDQSFYQLVIEKSKEVPVLVDFWSEKCSPCRQLGPMLEKTAAEYQGRFILAKLDILKSPQVTAYFKIKSVPAVKLFINGKIADEFIGAIPENKIKDFLKKYIKLPGDELLIKAAELFNKGEYKKAENILIKILEKDESNNTAKLILAKIFILTGRISEVDDMAKNSVIPEMKFLSDAAEFWELRGEEEAESESETITLDRQLKKASSKAVNGEYHQALELLLQILKIDKKFKNDLPRKAMLSIFVLLGDDNPLVDEYRRKLTITIF